MTLLVVPFVAIASLVARCRQATKQQTKEINLHKKQQKKGMRFLLRVKFHAKKYIHERLIYTRPPHSKKIQEGGAMKHDRKKPLHACAFQKIFQDNWNTEYGRFIRARISPRLSRSSARSKLSGPTTPAERRAALPQSPQSAKRPWFDAGSDPDCCANRARNSGASISDGGLAFSFFQPMPAQ